MKSRALNAVKLADFGNGYLQDNCECIDIKMYAFRRVKPRYKISKKYSKGQSMDVCRRNVVRDLYLWDIGHHRFPPFSAEFVHTASVYIP